MKVFEGLLLRGVPLLLMLLSGLLLLFGDVVDLRGEGETDLRSCNCRGEDMLRSRLLSGLPMLLSGVLLSWRIPVLLFVPSLPRVLGSGRLILFPEGLLLPFLS